MLRDLNNTVELHGTPWVDGRQGLVGLAGMQIFSCTFPSLAAPAECSDSPALLLIRVSPAQKLTVWTGMALLSWQDTKSMERGAIPLPFKQQASTRLRQQLVAVKIFGCPVPWSTLLCIFTSCLSCPVSCAHPDRDSQRVLGVMVTPTLNQKPQTDKLWRAVLQPYKDFKPTKLTSQVRHLHKSWHGTDLTDLPKSVLDL